MKFTLEIELGNDAMTDADDVSEAIYGLSRRLAGHRDPFELQDGNRIMDSNGNRVGQWEITE